MSLVTDTGSFSAQVDFAKATSLASAATVNLGASNGNTVIILGTTTITSLGTAPQAGVKRTVKFNDALILTNGADLVLFGGANVTTVAGDIAEFTAMTTTTWEMTGWFRPTAYTGGQFDTDAFLNGAVTSEKIADEGVLPINIYTKQHFVATDADNLLTADIMQNWILSITPTTARSLQSATALNILAELGTYITGTWYEFTIVNLAAFNVTLTTNTGITIYGSPVVNNASATFLISVTSPTTVAIFRK